MKRLFHRLFLFILLFYGINLLVYFFFENRDSRVAVNKELKHLKWDNIHNKSNKYNLIFLGSSRGYSAYNPIIVDSLTGLNSFNMCTGSQSIIESYYFLVDLLNYQQPKYVVYEMFLPSFSNYTDYFNMIINLQFIQSKTDRLKMLAKGYGIKGFLNYLLPLVRDKELLKVDLERMIFNKRKRRSVVTRDLSKEWVKGYHFDNRVVDSISISNFTDIYNFSNTVIEEKQINYYFNAFVKLCIKNNIELICVRAPYPPSRISISDKDTASLYFQKTCKDLSLPFYDFNYLKDNNYIYNDTDFSDYHHMNCYGASKVSKQLSNFLIDISKNELE
jgi:hypothetical protein